MPTLGVVVPAYRPDVDRLVDYLRDLAAALEPDRLRVELDAPDAATLEALSALELDVLSVNAVPYRRGKGAAITTGFEALETDQLVFVDADGSTPAGAVIDIVAALEEADVAVGSRRHPEATVTSHQTLARRYMGDGYAWLARRLLDAQLYDYQCGAKAVTAAAWERLRDHLYEPGFAWDVELLAMAAALECTITEIPIEWEDMPGSTVSPIRSSLAMAWTLVVVRHRAKRVQDSQLHAALARGADPIALVDRE